MNKIILGKTTLKTNVILAPMAGITDLPFRRIIREFGDFLMYSEMVASQALIRHVKKTHKIMDRNDDELTAVQLVGADPNVMSDAAKLSYDLGARFLDINMGCPVKKIVKSDSGSALMKNEKLAAEIIESVVKSVNIPVTLKMRLGWDMENKNAPNIAKIAQDLGIQMITIHARTRSQLYSGKANWKEIKNVKEIVNIPVIANGDIIDIESAKQALKESNADGIMIGRGSLGKPWLLKEIHDFLENNIKEPILILDNQKKDIAKKHIEYIFEFYPEETAIKLSRKALISYCYSIKNAAKYREKLNTTSSKSNLFELFNEIFN